MIAAGRQPVTAVDVA